MTDALQSSTSLSPIVPHKQHSPPSKASEEEQRDHSPLVSQSPQLRSLQELNSSLCSAHKQSAFTIYNVEANPHPFVLDQAQSSQLSNSSVSGNQTHPRGHRDKREQYRLQTKNLNRFFRSKINQMLRDIKQNPSTPHQHTKASQLLGRLNQSNKIMFSEIREVIKDQWLQQKLRKCTGMLLRYVHKGKMGMQSKLIMLKYFNKILKAIRTPDLFTCWK